MSSRFSASKRRVLAFYYPWFTPSSYDSETLSDRPLDKFGTMKPPGTDELTRMARGAGIDGFMVSWMGAAANGVALDNLLDAAAETDGVATVLLETPYANASGKESDPADPAVVERWLREALARTSSSGFLRSDGVPVVFVYRMHLLTRDVWRGILDRLADDGHTVRLVGDVGLTEYDGAVWGRYEYDPGEPSKQATFNKGVSYSAHLLQPDGQPPRLFAATVQPGFDDAGDVYPVRERGEGGERYRTMWDNALASQPDWVLITSWNEWFEGTAIQPSERFGDLALQQTAQYAARFHS